jgi:hypothetical protein
VPHGTRVAFIQSVGGTSTLSTTITGLTVGSFYTLQFRANARNGDPPQASYALNGAAPVSFTASPPRQRRPRWRSATQRPRTARCLWMTSRLLGPVPTSRCRT